MMLNKLAYYSARLTDQPGNIYRKIGLVRFPRNSCLMYTLGTTAIYHVNQARKY